jgi:hypothetical protein
MVKGAGVSDPWGRRDNLLHRLGAFAVGGCFVNNKTVPARRHARAASRGSRDFSGRLGAEIAPHRGLYFDGVVPSHDGHAEAPTARATIAGSRWP